MKILIFGSGVIGSIYGYILKEAGFDITHYVRSNTLREIEKGISLNLLDTRKRKKSNISKTYLMKTVEDLPSFDNFDLVIVSVRHYQLDSVLPLLSKKIGRADILFFNHLWTDFETINRYIPKEKYLWGFPSAGGGFVENNNLNGVIMNQISLGEVTGELTPRLEKMKSIFKKANIEVKCQKNMQHWLWKQFALNAGISSMIAKSGGADKFLNNLSNLHQGVLCIRENLTICKLRGIEIKEFGDAKAFFLPSWLATFGLWVMMKKDIAQRTIFQLYNGADEIKKTYSHVMEKGNELNINMPQMGSLKKYIDHVEDIYR